MEHGSPPVATSPTAASSGDPSSLESIVRSGVQKLHPFVMRARTVDQQCEEHKACSPQPHLRHDLMGQGRGKQVGGSGHPGCTCHLHSTCCGQHSATSRRGWRLARVKPGRVEAGTRHTGSSAHLTPAMRQHCILKQTGLKLGLEPSQRLLLCSK